MGDEFLLVLLQLQLQPSFAPAPIACVRYRQYILARVTVPRQAQPESEPRRAALPCRH